MQYVDSLMNIQSNAPDLRWKCDFVFCDIEILEMRLTQAVPQTDERVENVEGGEEQYESGEDWLEELSTNEDVECEALDTQTHHSQQDLSNKTNYYLYERKYNFYSSHNVLTVLLIRRIDGGLDWHLNSTLQ